MRKNVETDNKSVRARSLICKYDGQTNTFRWYKRAVKLPMLRKISNVGFAHWKISCGHQENTCLNPNDIFDNGLVSLNGFIGRPQALYRPFWI